jgi:hypothetical protein
MERLDGLFSQAGPSRAVGAVSKEGADIALFATLGEPAHGTGSAQGKDAIENNYHYR